MTKNKTLTTDIVFVKLIFCDTDHTALSILYRTPNGSLGEHISFNFGHRKDKPIQLDARKKSFIEWDERTGKVLEININLIDTPIH